MRDLVCSCPSLILSAYPWAHVNAYQAQEAINDSKHGGHTPGSQEAIEAAKANLKMEEVDLGGDDEGVAGADEQVPSGA